MSQGITVPVNLQIQNLQSLVGDLQKQLGNLKVGSSGFQAVQQIIMSIRKEIDKLSVQTAKPFINASQFTKAESSVDKLEDKLVEMGMSIQKIKFSDLELSAGQKADLKAFEDSINSIKDKLKTVKQSVKQDFLGSTEGQQWLKIDETAATKSLEKITSEVAKAAQVQKQKLDELKQSASDYQKALAESQRIKDFTDKMVDDPSNGTDIFSKKWQELTKQLSNNKIVFKEGGKNLMVQWLESQLKLDSGVLDSLLKQGVSATNIGQKLKQLLNDQLAKDQSIITNNSGAEAAANEAAQKYEQLEAILQRVGLSEQQIAQVTTALGASLRDTANAQKEYEQELVKTAQKGMDVSTTTDAMKTQLDNLRSTLSQTNAQFIQMQRTQQSFNQMKMAIVNFMGFNQVLNLTKRTVKEAMNHIKELDTVMNKISIVTDMSTGDLWGQIDQYSKMAQSYGVSIKGAYEVSQIYYQQGLETADVMTLTNETLKLAKISGLDYAQTTDYMTTALRGFKMEMSEASTVVDVYSNLAANTAVSQEELAVAMSKTASSMESVGSTFEETSAMIATMVAVTRESATNIGSAMKSIASRYGELTKDPTKLVDEDGEAMAFNKVDAALQSVGISMKTVDGQFREFTDVIVELSERWDELDSTQQRYIATQFAGNRQQSRFLALVSNKDILKANLDVAENSEDIGTLQALKALDSIESKMEQVKVAYQQFYTTIGAENAWKGFLDGATNVINTLNNLPKLFGKIPVGAIAAIGSVINLIKTIGVQIITGIAEILGNGFANGMLQAQSSAAQGATTLWERIKSVFTSKQTDAVEMGKTLGTSAAKGFSEGQAQNPSSQQLSRSFTDWSSRAGYLSKATEVVPGQLTSGWNSLANEINASISLTDRQFKIITAGGPKAAALIDQLKQKYAEAGTSAETAGSRFKNFLAGHESAAKALTNFGSALNMAAMMIDTSKAGMKTLSGSLMSISGVAQIAGSAWQGFITHIQTGNSILSSIPWMAVITGIFAVINGISTLVVTPEEKLEELTKKAEELSNEAKQAKADYNIIDRSVKKLDELKEKRYESAEAAEEYQTAVDELASKYPELIKSFDSMGNVILDAAAMENTLTEARQNAAEAAYIAAKAEAERAKQELVVKDNSLYSKIGNVNSLRNSRTKLASYQREDGGYNNIVAFGGGNSLIKYLESNEQKLTETEQQLLNYISNLNEDNRGNGEILASLLKSITTSAKNENYADSQTYINLYRMAFESMDWTMPEYQKKYLDELSSAMKEIFPLINTIESANKQMVNSWLRASKYYDIPFISSNSGLSTMFQSQLYNMAGGDYSSEHLEKLASELLQGPLEFWKSLNEDEQALFDKMFNDTKNYTKDDFEEKFGKKAFFSAINDILEKYYNPDIATIQKRANASLAQAMGKEADTNGDFETITYQTEGITEAQKKLLWMASKNLTLTEEKFYNNILSQYESLMKEGYSGRANDFAVAASKLYGQIDNAPAEIEAQLWEVINSNGLNTLEGIQKIRDTIKNNKSLQGYIDEQTLTDLENNIIPKINLEIQAATSNLLENWEDISKDLSKAMSSGMTIKEADELIAKAESLGVKINLSDFDTSGDKLILTAEKFNEYFASLRESASTTATKWETEIEKAGTVLQKANSFQHLNENDLVSIKAIIPNFDFEKYYVGGKLTAEGIAELADAIYKSQQSLDKYNEYSKIAAQQIAKSWNWSQGNYFDFDYINQDGNVTKIYTSAIQNIEQLEEAIAQDAIKHFSKTGDDAEKRAILDNVYKSYDAFLSDVISKGFENIRLEDYEGLVKDHIKDTDLTGSYQSFIERYGKWVGKSISEMNDLLAQAIEKDLQGTSAEGLKDLQFIDGNTFTASIQALNNFAKEYNLDLQEVLKVATQQLDGTYRIEDISKIEGFDSSRIKQFKETISDSVDTFWSDLIKSIQEGLSGSLTGTKANDLYNQISGIVPTEISLDFTRTAEGLQLTEDSFFNLYASIERIDKSIAKKLLPDLSKLSKNYSTLPALLKELGESAEGTAKRLTLIQAVKQKAGEPDSYKYLTGDFELPGNIQSYYNYLSESGQGIQIAQNMGKGSVEVSDAFMLLSFIQKSGIDIKEGQNINQVMSKFASFMKLDEKTLKPVFDSAAFLKEYGIKTEDLIDALQLAQDKVNETGQNQQDLYDTLTAFSTISEADWNEAFENQGETFNQVKWQEIIKENEQVKYALDNIMLSNKSLTDWIKESNLTEEQQKTITNLLKQLKETDWDWETLQQQFEDMAQKNDLDLVIDENNEVAFEVKQGKKPTIIYTTSDGMKFNSQQDRDKYIIARDLAEKSGSVKDIVLDEETGTRAKHITYEESGETITLDVISEADGTATFKYSATINDVKFTAESEEGLFESVKLYALTQSDFNNPFADGKEVKTNEPSSETVTIEVEGKKVELKFNKDGTFEIADNDKNNQQLVNDINKALEERKKAAEEAAKEAEGQSVEASVNDVNIRLNENANVNLVIGEGELQASNNIPVVSANANILKILNALVRTYGGEKSLTKALGAVSGEADSLEITPVEVLALINGLAPRVSGKLKDIKYLEELNVILSSIAAQYNDVPTDTDQVFIGDFTYAEAVAAVLGLILLTTDDSTSSNFDTVTIDDSEFTYADTVQALLTYVSLYGTDVTGDLSDTVTINDKDFTLDQVINALISSLTINGTDVLTEKGTITLGEGEDEIPIGKLIGLITGLLAKWAEGASKEPDYKALGLKTEYQAPPATVIQQVKVAWGLTNEGEELDNLAAEITDLLGQVDFETDRKTGHIVLAVDETDVTLPDDFDLQGLITNIQQKMQEYINKGGTKYAFDEQHNIIDLTAELNTETVDNSINEYSETPVGIPTSFKAPDTSAVDNFTPQTKLIPTKLAPSDANYTVATGNVALAGGTPTLMGELGPELVVSHGRYFVVGQGGAEMVDLDKDAIVFNHIQTRQLLNNGKTGRGTPTVNERISAGMATGNVNGGPAHPDLTRNRNWAQDVGGGQGRKYDTQYISYRNRGGQASYNSWVIDWENWNKTGRGNNKPTEITLEGLTKDQQSKLASLISDLITKGIDSIDWAEIEKTFGKDLAAEMKKAAQNGSLRDFVKKYGDYCGKTLKEINELYFQAWEADLGTRGETFQNALSGLQFFAGGSVGGSASDWTTILSQYGLKISDLVDKKLLKWDEDLGTYVLTSTERLWDEFKVDLSGTHKVDSLTSTMNEINDLLEQAINGSISEKDKKKLEDELSKSGITNLGEIWTESGALDFTKLETIRKRIKNSKTLSDKQKEQWLAQIDQLVADEQEVTSSLIEKGATNGAGLSPEDKANLIKRFNLVDSDFETGLDGKMRLTADAYSRVIEEAKKQKRTTSAATQSLLDKITDDYKKIAEETSNWLEEAVNGTISAQNKTSLLNELEKMGLDTKLLKWNENGYLDISSIQDLLNSDKFKDLPKEVQNYYKSYLTDLTTSYNSNISSLLSKAELSGGAGLSAEEKDKLMNQLGLEDTDFVTDAEGMIHLTEQGYKTALQNAQKRQLVSSDTYNSLLAQVEDSKKEIFKEIISSISNGINGELSAGDVQDLLAKMSKNGLGGILTEEDFTELSSGYGLSTERLADIKKRIKKQVKENKISQAFADSLMAQLDQMATDSNSTLRTSLETAVNDGLSDEERQALQDKLKLAGLDQISDKFWKKVGDKWVLNSDEYKKRIKELQDKKIITSTQASEALAAVEDSLRETINSINDLFSNAFKGELSRTDFNKLNTYLKENGLSKITDNMVTETADGYILKLKAVNQLIANINDSKLSAEQKNKLIASLEDNVREIMKSISDSLSNAITTGLSSTDLNKLNAQLEASGLSQITDNMVTETADGYILKLEAIDQLISNINNNTKLSAEQKNKLIASLKDSLNENINSLIGFFENASTGALSNADFNKLSAQLNTLGIDMKQDISEYITETADGVIIQMIGIKKVLSALRNKTVKTEQDRKLQASLEDTIRSIASSTSDLLGQVMNGGISSIDLNQLRTQLGSLGLSNITDDMFTETVDGWIINLQNIPAISQQIAKSTTIPPKTKAKLKAAIQDNLRTITSNISDLLENVLTGTLTSADLNSLNSQLQAIGLTKISEGLRKTADGWMASISQLTFVAKQVATSALPSQQKAKLQATIKDSIRTMVDTITESITKGLNGELSEIDLLNLNTMLKTNGFSAIGKDMLIKTANGYAIKISEVNKLINATLANTNLNNTQKRTLINSLRDTIDTNIASIGDLIAKGLSGELAGADVEQLKALLKANGLTKITDSVFVQTTNGWAISLKNAAKWLKTIDNSGLTQAQKDKLKNAVQTAIESAVSSISDLITKGLSGELSYADMNSLKSLLSTNGFNKLSDKVLQETVNGWMINLEGAQVLIAQIAANKGLSSNQKAQLTAAINDAVREASNTIASLISQGMTGSLSNADFNKLQSYLRANNIAEISESAITQTVDGLKLSNAEAIRLYTALKNVNDMASRIVLKQLIEDLKSSNEHYKTMSGTLARIKELQEQIAKYEKTNEAKANQYREELAIAKEIATVRATTDDDSMNFLNADLPSGFNNPLNYIQNWITGIKNLRDALGTDGSGIMDFQSLYNMAREVNQQAAAAGKSIQFLGYTFDGSAQALSKFGIAMADALGSTDDGFGVILSKLGLNMKDGANGYAEDADEAMKTMAKAQIAILDELITYFEGLAALETLGDIDTNLDGILDISEIFKNDGKKNAEGAREFTDETVQAVNSIWDKIEANSDLKKLAQSIKVGKYSIYQIIKDMKDGKANLKLTSQQYADVLNALMKMAQGDFDLTNLPEALRQAFNDALGDKNQIIDLGTRAVNVKYGFTIEQDENGNWTGTDGKKYKTRDAAMQASVLNSLGSDMDKAEDGENGDKQVTKYVGLNNYEMKYVVNSKGETSYWYDGKSYKTLDEVYTAIWKKTRENGNKQSENEWRASQGLPEKAVKKNNTTWELDLNKENQVLKIGKAEYTVSTKTDANGTVYTYDGQKYTSLEELQRAIWKKDKKKNKKTGKDETFEEWKARVGLTTEVDTKITADGVGVQDLTSAGISAILNKSWAQIKEEWDNAVKEGKTEKFEATYGFKFDANTTEEDWENWRKKIGTMDILIKTFAVSDDAKKSIQELFGIGENGIKLNLTGAAKEDIEAIQNLLKQINSKTIKVNIEGNAINTLTTIIKKLGKIKDTGTQVTVNQTGGGEAKGNVALAAGRTLMGELGPELVVAGGRYYTVGNNGAEFVNLPKDAIVFNHLQTQRLLAGGSVGRGTPAVNEAAAVSFVKGTALASASETLAQLKTLRAMWQSLLSSSIKDLIGTVAANSGSSSSNRTGAWLQEVERWYDLLQKIARLEKEINKAESERNFIQSQRVISGTRLYELDVQELANYKEQAAAQKQLYVEQKKRWDIRREELNKGPISTFYTYDDKGQLKFKDEGFAKLEAIVHQTDEGKTMSASDQLAQMLSYNPDLADYMKYDSSGLAIEREEDETNDAFALRQLQALWDRMESERNELQSLYDASEDAYNSYYEAMTNANNILNAMYDNQRDLEDKVLTAIEKQRQDTIDTLTEERQALSDSASKYISSLTDALNNEKAMYENSENEADLAKLRRQLSILQRNGGSASQIADLQSQIAEKDRNAYYDAQQDSIDAVQEASDLELEKLQEQIDLMTETLDYEKAHGLLWDEVRDIMSQDSSTITDFITGHDDTWLSKSTLAQEEELRTLNSSVEQWIGFRDTSDETLLDVIDKGIDKVVDALYDKDPVTYIPGEQGTPDSKNPYIDEGKYTQGASSANGSNGGSNGSNGNNNTNMDAAQQISSGNFKYKVTAEDYAIYKKQVNKAKEGEEAKWVDAKSGNLTSEKLTATATGDNWDEVEKEAAKALKTAFEEKYPKDKKHQYILLRWKESTAEDGQVPHMKRGLSYRAGGEVNYTGTAEVHGSNERPEYMLNADEYKVWKHQIVGGGNSSLMSRLSELNAMIGHMEDTSSYEHGSGEAFVIENASVNMYVDEIANDYDAQRAGEQALEKIMQIARKSSSNNRIGR